jgi:hypothetical protein
MKSVLFVVAAAVLCMSFAAQGQAGTITDLYNTGVYNPTTALAAGNPLLAGTPLPDGTVGDPNYTLSGVPSGSSQTLVINSTGGWPVPPYIGDDSLSAWIGPSNAADLNGPPGDYFYKTTFTVNGSPSNVSISGQWASDNEEIAIFLNPTNPGHPTNGLVYVAPPGIPNSDGYVEDFYNWSSFTIPTNRPFISGTNTLVFEVWNEPYFGGYTGDNPTALRVEMTAGGLVTGTPIPEPVSMIFFGTGLVAVGGYVARRRMLRNG